MYFLKVINDVTWCGKLFESILFGIYGNVEFYFDYILVKIYVGFFVLEILKFLIVYVMEKCACSGYL